MPAVGGAPVSTQGVPAERATRLAAAGIDGLIQLAICLPAIFGAVPGLAAAVGDYSTGVADLNPMALLFTIFTGPGAVVSLLCFIAWAAITTWLVWKNSQSIGKRLLGIKIVRTDGSRASLGRIFWLRNVLNAIPGWLPYIGLLYQLVDPLFIYQDSRQCLHDKIAGTIVIKASPPPSKPA